MNEATDESEVELEDDSSDDGYSDEMEMLEQEEESEGEQERDDRESDSLEDKESGLMQNAPTSIPEYNIKPEYTLRTLFFAGIKFSDFSK